MSSRDFGNTGIPRERQRIARSRSLRNHLCVILRRLRCAVLLDAGDATLHGGTRGIHLARADGLPVGGVAHEKRLLWDGMLARVQGVLRRIFFSPLHTVPGV